MFVCLLVFGGFYFFFLLFFFAFKPVSQIKPDTVHHRQETLEGAVCRAEQRPRAVSISLPSLPLALTRWLLEVSPPASPGEMCQLHISWGHSGTPGGTALLLKAASARHMIWGLSKPRGCVCWLPQVLVLIPANCTRSQRSKVSESVTRSSTGFVN